MVTILHLFRDLTFQEETKKTKESTIVISDTNHPEFTEGKSIFKERPLPIYKFWKKRRNLGIYLDGDLALYLLEQQGFHSKFGTAEDWETYLAGRMEKLRNKTKIMETWQIFLVIGLLIAIIVLQLKSMGVFNG